MSSNLQDIQELDETSESPISEAPRYTCALGGAYISVLATYGAVPVLHSGGGCGITHFFWSLAAGGKSSGPVSGANTPCSSLLEEHVVYGGEEKLRDLIKSTHELMNGDLFVVIPGCVPALIGDDVESVISEFKDQFPVVYVNTSGFAGNSYKGYESYLEALIDQLLPKSAPEKDEKLVNIIGVAPGQHVFWSGDLQVIKNVLEKVGLKANIIFGELNGLENIKEIPKAAYNIVLSPWLGVNAAQKLKDLYETDYILFPSVPVGPKQTTNFLQKVGEKLEISEEKLNEVIEREEKIAYRTLEYIGDVMVLGLPNAYIGVVADSNYAIGITKFLTNELGYLPEIVIITDNPPVDQRDAIIKELTEGLEIDDKPEVRFEIDSHKIRGLLQNRKFLFLLSSSLEKYLAQEEFHAAHLSVSYPTWDRLILDRTYAGYRGGHALMEDFISKTAGPL